MKKLIELLKPYRNRLMIVGAVNAIGMMTTLFMPFVMGEIVDNGIAKGNFKYVIICSVVLFFLAILTIMSNLTSNKINSQISEDYTADVLKSTFKKINTLSYSQYGVNPRRWTRNKKTFRRIALICS